MQLPSLAQLQVWVAMVEGLSLISDSEEAEPVVGPLLVPEAAPDALSALVLAFFGSMSDIFVCVDYGLIGCCGVVVVLLWLFAL